MLVATSTTTGPKPASLRGIVTMLLATAIGTTVPAYLFNKIKIFTHYFPCRLAKISRNWIDLVAPFERKADRLNKKINQEKK